MSPSMRDIMAILAESARLTEEQEVFSYRVIRYHEAINETSNKLRLGTWYAVAEDYAQRYNQDRVRLGGKTRTSGVISCRSPFIIDRVANHLILTDVTVARELPFAANVTPLSRPKDRKTFLAAARRIVTDRTLLAKILRLGTFNAMTILTDRIAAEWLKDNGYDLLVIQGMDHEPREIFDFNNLFKPTKQITT